MTSRIVPAGTGGETLMLPVHALSLPEAVALARELPNLRGLLHAGDAGDRPVRAPAGSTVADDRDRVRRVLHVMQAHPKLMELADVAAADRTRLDAQLEAAERAAAGAVLARALWYAGRLAEALLTRPDPRNTARGGQQSLTRIHIRRLRNASRAPREFSSSRSCRRPARGAGRRGRCGARIPRSCG
jgi:hypothetical protein